MGAWAAMQWPKREPRKSRRRPLGLLRRLEGKRGAAKLTAAERKAIAKKASLAAREALLKAAGKRQRPDGKEEWDLESGVPG
jgi:hypothetical protein